MKLITTIYSGSEVDIILMVQSRQTRGPDKQPVVNESMITRYTSKVGNESLIFNPSIAMNIRSRLNREAPDAMIPLNLIYRFTTSLMTVYQKLQSEKLYHEDGGSLYVDQKKALEISRKISLFRNSLTITPGVISDRTGKLMKGITLNVEGNAIGTMSHNEALSVLDLMDHFDITTFSLLAGLVDEMEHMGDRINIILEKVTNIESLLIAMNSVKKNTQSAINVGFNPSQLQWENADITLF